MDPILNFTVDQNEELLTNVGWTQGEIDLGRRLIRNPYLQDIGRLEERRIQTVWAQLNIRGEDKRVDFLVFTPEFVCVIEVKDYRDFNSDKTKPWTSSNAFDQCREYVTILQERIGRYIPIFGIVAFPFIEEEEFEELAMEVRARALAPDYNLYTWFADEVHIKKYKNLLHNSAKSVNLAEGPTGVNQMICAMNQLIPHLSVEQNADCTDDLPLKIFDRQQLNMSHDYTRTGDRILYGVAGSGKTMIIINRVKQIKKLQPQSKVLVVCYNAPLRQYLENQLRKTGAQVFTLHGWYRSILQRWDPVKQKRYLSVLESASNAYKNDYFASLADRIDEGLSQGKTLPHYDHILIDEGQDFQKDWLKHLKMAHSGDDLDLFLVCLDSMQAIHHRDKNSFHWSDVGIRAPGRTIYLRKNYRNRSKVGEYAISKLRDLEDKEGDEEVQQFLAIRELPRKGGKVITKTLSYDALFPYLATLINDKPEDFSGMIIHDKIKAPRRLFGVRKYGLQDVRIWDCVSKSAPIMPSAKNIPIYSVYRSKGLEADIVIFIHPPVNIGQQINYVAITRAREQIIDIELIEN